MVQPIPTHPTALTFAALFLISLLGITIPAQGRSMPHSTVQNMCFTADLIVAGEHLGNGKVRVDHVFYPPMPATGTIKTINVPSVTEHNKVVGGFFTSKENPPPIATKRLVLFLEKYTDGRYEPIYKYGQGSQGLFWYDNEKCYGYQQFVRGYSLTPSEAPRARQGGIPYQGRTPHGKDAMWHQIKVGLEQRWLWEAVEAIKDPATRARKMAAYLLPHTAPEGYTHTRDLRKVIRKMGPDAVPALVEVLEKAKPDDQLNTTVLILYDIGQTAPEALRPAVPALCKLLANPGPTIPYYILSPLKNAADPRAIPHVRPLLQHKSKQARGQAARALAAMNDQEAFDLIVAMIEDPPLPQDSTDYTLDLARSLFKLDPARARPIIKQIESNPGNAGLHFHIQGYE